ncbi:hypothetical protein [Flagellimonas sp.]|uniref:hypothetical protein n=1 Tax=Flagellimonas sp. TaxID=2058762 RepID=UPI003C7C1A5A
MNNKDLALSLVHADTENEIINILKKEGYWDKSDDWQLYGGKENNFATIGNQKSRAEDALVEKIVNSVDAVLMAECLKRGFKTDSKEAPTSIADALEKFYNIHNGKLSNITPNERTKLAENIALVSTGSKSNPCYSIIDKGEGQSPNRLPDTILSIDKNNKLRTPFVQGKFNMGGTAVLRFCGRENLQLIISKRNPKIKIQDASDDSINYWGVTIVRRENPPQGVRSSIYKYLAPNNKILRFESDSLKLMPGNYPNAYQNELSYGTFIKLYEYQMTGLKTNILFDLNYKLSLLMPSIALPVRLYERRKGYKGHTLETTLSGLSVRLDEDKKENLESGFPVSGPITALGQKMRASIFAFKRGRSTNYTRDEGIIFVINGQTHGTLSKSFFTRNAVRHSYIADSLLVVVDCSELDGRAREDLFLNSRDRLASGELRSQIERELEILLREHKGLNQLRERRRREDIEDKLEDSKPLADVIQDILKKSPTLSKLFIKGVRLPNPFNIVNGKREEQYEGKKFPTFFTLIKEYPEIAPKDCPKNVRFRVQYKTDAVNDYFDRDNDPGKFSLYVNGTEVENKQINPWNGYINLNVLLPDNVTVGDVLCFESKVEDVSLIEPFVSRFYIRVTDAEKKNNSSNEKNRKNPSTDNKGNEGENTSHLDLPNVIEVFKNDKNWVSKEFENETALHVFEDGQGGYDFFINMNNIHLLSEQKSNGSIDSKLLNARYKYGMVLIGIALLKENNDNTEKSIEDSKNQVGNIFTETVN